MEQNENDVLVQNDEIRNNLLQIKRYLETDIHNLRKQLSGKDAQIKLLKEEVDKLQHLAEGNRQLVNKLLGDISKMQNDIEWYKRTYEKRSFLGTIREKLLRKRR